MKYKYYKILLTALLSLLSSIITYAEDCKVSKDSSRLTVAGGSLTEIVYLLGQEKKLTAVDITSNYPDEAKELPSIGYVRALSAEGVLSLSPTLILGENDMGPPAVIEQLDRVGIQIEIIPEENTARGIINKVECVANILNVKNEIKSEVIRDLVSIKQDLDKLKNIENPKRVMFILGMESGSPTVGGIGTSADGLIKMIGAINVMDSFEGWKPVSTEAIIEAKPDFILISNRGLSSYKTVENLAKQPSLMFTPAAKNNNIIAMDGMAMLGFGPRTLQVAKDISSKFTNTNE
tara:strand:+ start:285 stop:1160 length:876 start_codon:yes stop_codon:yes gene_type:complete